MVLYTRSGIAMQVNRNETGGFDIDCTPASKTYNSLEEFYKGEYNAMTEILDVVYELNQGTYKCLSEDTTAGHPVRPSAKAANKKNGDKQSKITEKKHSHSITHVPAHEDFYTTTALLVWNAAIVSGATTEGALLLVTQAGNESGYSGDKEGIAIKYKDYNLFGKMTTNKSEFSTRPIKNKNVKIKKFENYEESIQEQLLGYSPKGHWQLFSDILQMHSFTSSDINEALNTGDCYPTAGDIKNGVHAYNSDIGPDGKNHYGEVLLNNYQGVKKGFLAALQYQIAQNNSLIDELSYFQSLMVITPEGKAEYEQRVENPVQQNEKYQKIIDTINAAKM